MNKLQYKYLKYKSKYLALSQKLEEPKQITIFYTKGRAFK